MLCATACPAHCIDIVGATAPDTWDDREKYPENFIIDELRCIYCGMCEEACPVDAIELTGLYDLTGLSSREQMVFDKDEAGSRVFDRTTAAGTDPVRTSGNQAGAGRGNRGDGDPRAPEFETHGTTMLPLDGPTLSWNSPSRPETCCFRSSVVDGLCAAGTWLVLPHRHGAPKPVVWPILAGAFLAVRRRLALRDVLDNGLGSGEDRLTSNTSCSTIFSSMAAVAVRGVLTARPVGTRSTGGALLRLWWCCPRLRAVPALGRAPVPRWRRPSSSTPGRSSSLSSSSSCSRNPARPCPMRTTARPASRSLAALVGFVVLLGTLSTSLLQRVYTEKAAIDYPPLQAGAAQVRPMPFMLDENLEEPRLCRRALPRQRRIPFKAIGWPSPSRCRRGPRAINRLRRRSERLIPAARRCAIPRDARTEPAERTHPRRARPGVSSRSYCTEIERNLNYHQGRSRGGHRPEPRRAPVAAQPVAPREVADRGETRRPRDACNAGETNVAATRALAVHGPPAGSRTGRDPAAGRHSSAPVAIAGTRLGE